MNFILSNLGKIILAAAAVLLMVLVLKNFQKIKSFLMEVKSELGKVAWSTRHELMGSTMVVIATTALMTVFIGVVDVILSKFLSIIFK